MKKALLILFLTFTVCSSFSLFADGDRFEQSEESVKNAKYGHIDAKALLGLIESQTPFVLLDARGDKWHDGNIIPNAKLASYEYSEEELKSIIGNKEDLIVVYCFSFNCPLSRRLADKLVDNGYKNVIEYPAGLKEWRDIAGYPIEEIK